MIEDKKDSLLVVIGLLFPLRSLPRFQNFLCDWFTRGSLHVLTQEIHIVFFI